MIGELRCPHGLPVECGCYLCARSVVEFLLRTTDAEVLSITEYSPIDASGGEKHG